VAYVTDVKPPRGERPITWTLLTNEPVRDFDDAWRVSEVTGIAGKITAPAGLCSGEAG